MDRTGSHLLLVSTCSGFSAEHTTRRERDLPDALKGTCATLDLCSSAILLVCAPSAVVNVTATVQGVFRPKNATGQSSTAFLLRPASLRAGMPPDTTPVQRKCSTFRLYTCVHQQMNVMKPVRHVVRAGNNCSVTHGFTGSTRSCQHLVMAAMLSNPEQGTRCLRPVLARQMLRHRCCWTDGLMLWQHL